MLATGRSMDPSPAVSDPDGAANTPAPGAAIGLQVVPPSMPVPAVPPEAPEPVPDVPPLPPLPPSPELPPSPDVPPLPLLPALPLPPLFPLLPLVPALFSPRDELEVEQACAVSQTIAHTRPQRKQPIAAESRLAPAACQSVRTNEPSRACYRTAQVRRRVQVTPIEVPLPVPLRRHRRHQKH